MLCFHWHFKPFTPIVKVNKLNYNALEYWTQNYSILQETPVTQPTKRSFLLPLLHIFWKISSFLTSHILPASDSVLLSTRWNNIRNLITPFHANRLPRTAVKRVDVCLGPSFCPFLRRGGGVIRNNKIVAPKWSSKNRHTHTHISTQHLNAPLKRKKATEKVAPKRGGRGKFRSTLFSELFTYRSRVGFTAPERALFRMVKEEGMALACWCERNLIFTSPPHHHSTQRQRIVWDSISGCICDCFAFEFADCQKQQAVRRAGARLMIIAMDFPARASFSGEKVESTVVKWSKGGKKFLSNYDRECSGASAAKQKNEQKRDHKNVQPRETAIVPRRGRKKPEQKRKQTIWNKIRNWQLPFRIFEAVCYGSEGSNAAMPNNSHGKTIEFEIELKFDC